MELASPSPLLTPKDHAMNLLDQPLGALARDIAGATKIFHEYALDFCCGGKHSLRDASEAAGVDGALVAARLQALSSMAASDERDWRAASPAELIAHLLARYHDVHRQQLPELIRLARRVEQVHGSHAHCPAGLADQLSAMQQALESHMQKEEQVLFPLLTSAAHVSPAAPISVLRMEHDEHGEALQRVADLTGNLQLPAGACNTWRALYLGLTTLREDLMQHIHLENNILFENAAPAGIAAHA
jgi:regulator of cell morphogenesis and NO signaling